MIAAVVPFKRLSMAKSRLAPRISSRGRAALMYAMLTRTVDALRHSGVVRHVAVTTSEPGISEALGLPVLPDLGSLNASLAGGVEWARRLGATGLVILPSDLPRITPDAVRSLTGEGDFGPGVVVAPAKDGGTGALFLSPPDAIQPAFGADSFRRHMELARRAGAVRSAEIEALWMDVDTADDLTALDPDLAELAETGATIPG